MSSRTDDIREAIAELKLGVEQVYELSPEEALERQIEIETRFLLPGLDWWFERLKSGTAFWGKGYRLFDERAVRRLCPAVDCFLLPIYDDDGEVFRTTTPVAARILAVSGYYEVALVAADLSWILIENHHQSLYGCGEPIETTLRALLDEPGNNGGPFIRKPA